MKFVAIDLEFNQFFPFPGANPGKGVNPRCPAEIMQIGAVVLDADLRIVAARSFFVRPQLYKRLHPHIKRVTRIDVAALKSAEIFPDVFEDFLAFMDCENVDDCAFLVWGRDDMTELFRNVMFYKLDFNRLPKRFVNVQAAANSFLKNPNTSIGLKSAAEALGLDVGRPFHDALSDALYTADILREILRREQETGTTPSDFVAALPVAVTDANLVSDIIAARMNDINLSPLYSFARKRLGRDLTDDEKRFAIAMYDAGRMRKFDSKRQEN